MDAVALAAQAVEAARKLTKNGETADEHQVVVERVAYAASIRHRLEPIAAILELGELRAAPDELRAPAAVEAIGTAAIASEGRIKWPLDEVLEEVRANMRAFAAREIAPPAENIHRHADQIPERFISAMGTAS